MATLVFSSVQAILGKAKVTQRTEVPNSHKAMHQVLPQLVSISETLGVNLDDTGFTYQVTPGKSGENMVYGPVVQAQGTDAVLVWGKLRYPLPELKVPMTLTTNSEGRIFGEFDLGDLEPGFLNVPLMLAKDDKGQPIVKPEDLKKLHRAGKLANALSEGIPSKLSEVPVGTYTIIGYRYETFKNDTKLIVTTLEMGSIKGNSAMLRRFSHQPSVSSETPATLQVMESTETHNGYPIVPVSIEFFEDKDLEVFEF